MTEEDKIQQRIRSLKDKIKKTKFYKSLFAERREEGSNLFKTVALGVAMATVPTVAGAAPTNNTRPDDKPKDKTENVDNSINLQTLKLKYKNLSQSQAEQIIDNLADSSFANYVEKYDKVAEDMIKQINRKSERAKRVLRMEKTESEFARGGVPAKYCVRGTFVTAVRADPNGIMRDIIKNWTSDGVVYSINQFKNSGASSLKIKNKSSLPDKDYDIYFCDTRIYNGPHMVSITICKDTDGNRVVHWNAFNKEQRHGNIKTCQDAISCYDMYNRQKEKIKKQLKQKGYTPELQVLMFINNYMRTEKGDMTVNSVKLDGQNVALPDLLEILNVPVQAATPYEIQMAMKVGKNVMFAEQDKDSPDTLNVTSIESMKKIEEDNPNELLLAKLAKSHKVTSGKSSGRNKPDNNTTATTEATENRNRSFPPYRDDGRG